MAMSWRKLGRRVGQAMLGGMEGRRRTGRGLSTSFYDTTVEKYALQPIQKLTIRQMIEFGRSVTPEKLILSGRFVHHELPVRLAKRILDLRTLPYIMVTNPYISRVYELYIQAFDRIRHFPPINDSTDEFEFTLLLKEIVGETVEVVDLLARGTSEVTAKIQHFTRLNMDEFLENMFLSRISRRVLAEQHIMLHRDDERDYVGVINTKCHIMKCIQAAHTKAAEICQNTYCMAPEVQFEGDANATIPFIPVHLEYICLELLKNSMRAVVEKHQYCDRLPPIKVLIAEGITETTIRISDQGGGIPKDHLKRVFHFGFTTAQSTELTQQQKDCATDFTMMDNRDFGSPMAGLGFGLPLSRLYAQHFGGGLQLVTLDNYGTDIYIRLDRTGDQVEIVEI